MNVEEGLNVMAGRLSRRLSGARPPFPPRAPGAMNARPARGYRGRCRAREEAAGWMTAAWAAVAGSSAAATGVIRWPGRSLRWVTPADQRFAGPSHWSGPLLMTRTHASDQAVAGPGSRMSVRARQFQILAARVLTASPPRPGEGSPPSRQQGARCHVAGAMADGVVLRCRAPGRADRRRAIGTGDSYIAGASPGRWRTSCWDRIDER